MNDDEIRAMERRARAYYRPGDRKSPSAMLADDLLRLIDHTATLRSTLDAVLARASDLTADTLRHGATTGR